MTNAALELARRRASRRRDEGGAVMFIVAMTTAVLASVGVFALAAAATEVKTSGNERQATQTHFLSDYGIISAADYLTGTVSNSAVGLATDPSTAATAMDTCVSLPGLGPSSSVSALGSGCRRYDLGEISKNWLLPAVLTYAGTAPFQSSGTPPAPMVPGSFGPQPMQGGFFFEVLTEKTQLAAGYSSNGACFVKLTVTSVGQLSPNTIARYSGMGRETQRARLVAGPLDKQYCQ